MDGCYDCFFAVFTFTPVNNSIYTSKHRVNIASYITVNGGDFRSNNKHQMQTNASKHKQQQKTKLQKSVLGDKTHDDEQALRSSFASHAKRVNSMLSARAQCALLAYSALTPPFFSTMLVHIF